LSWGRGVSRGVSDWYLVGGRPLVLSTVNAGIYGAPSDASSLFIYPSELRDRAGKDLLERLDQIALYKKKLAESRTAGWTKKYPACVLTSVLPSAEERSRLLRAFGLVTDTL
jgi:hypothetical protein